MNKRFISAFTLLVAVLLSAVPSAAQSALSNTDRQRWLSELRTYKHEFLTRELDLTREQQRDFLPLYDRMEDDIEELNASTRELESKITDESSDLELENTARTVFELKRAEGQIEMTYFDKFRSILKPRQLFKLKSAERVFTQQLVNQHRRMRSVNRRK